MFSYHISVTVLNLRNFGILGLVVIFWLQQELKESGCTFVLKARPQVKDEWRGQGSSKESSKRAQRELKKEHSFGGGGVGAMPYRGLFINDKVQTELCFKKAIILATFKKYFFSCTNHFKIEFPNFSRELILFPCK